jgi:hypothetical protein
LKVVILSLITSRIAEGEAELEVHQGLQKEMLSLRFTKDCRRRG